MPTYAKFLKEIFSKKRKIEDNEIISLITECNTLIQNKLPHKLKDLGSFVIPCEIGSLSFDRVLCDLGHNINLIPLIVYKMLGLCDMKPSNITLQLADMTVEHALGVLEDVPIKVRHLYIITYFLIMDI